MTDGNSKNKKLIIQKMMLENFLRKKILHRIKDLILS